MTFTDSKIHSMKFITALVFLLLLADVLSAQSDILITPYRVVFEEGERIKEVSIVNTGTDTARYLISFVQYRMTDIGRMEQISEPDEGQLFADRHLRVFPRSVVLPPDEAQLVRLQLRAPSGLEEGEYRSHLYFRSEGHRERTSEIDENETRTEGLGVRLIPIYGITIPVIFRVGSTRFELEVDSIELVRENDQVLIEMKVNRNGNQSVFGNIEVHYDDGNEKHKVYEVRGVAIYTPNKYRIFRIPLANLPNVDYTSGHLTIEYLEGRGQPRRKFLEHRISLDEY
ncbi:MAG: molecular chaperone [Saprospirales bacterium]|nr:MAG: molecular chaperone [Saprospirales bacterium]